MGARAREAGSELGARVARYEASALGYLVWVGVGAGMLGLGGFAALSAGGVASAAFAVGAGCALAGAGVVVYALHFRRGARIDLHESGFVYAAGGRRRVVPAGSFTITGVVSWDGLPPVVTLAAEGGPLAIRTHWFRASDRLVQAIARLECPALTETEDALGPASRAEPFTLTARTGLTDAVREGLAKRGFRLQQRLLLLLFSVAALLVWAWIDYRSLRLVESGLAESAGV